MAATLKAQLAALVAQSKTDLNAVNHLHEMFRQATDWRDRQQVKLAIYHAEKNWK
jgi:hypothetical protein